MTIAHYFAIAVIFAVPFGYLAWTFARLPGRMSPERREWERQQERRLELN